MAGFPLNKWAEVLVRYSTAVRPDEVVSLVGSSWAEPLLVALYKQVLLAGGHPLIVMTPAACPELLYRHGNDSQLTWIDPLETVGIEKADVAIHVIADDEEALAKVDLERQALGNVARRPLMQRFMQRVAKKSLRWVATPYPCSSSASAVGMTVAEFEALMLRAGMLDRDNSVAAWQAQSARQQSMISFLQEVHELRFVTQSGTDLRVGVAGRTWVNCDGHENFPDGEVFTGPIEDATEGTVCFDLPSSYAGRRVQGVRLVFRAGRVVEASAAVGEDFIHCVLSQDDGADVLGEVALGCNYALARHTCNPILDEKIGGTFHVALGASYPGSGGVNVSCLHWDMVCDPRPGGRVEADGKVIARDGLFLNPHWPRPDR